MWAAGEHYDLDCLIFASGFEVGTEQSRRAGFEVAGRDGRTLTEHWAEGMRSMHGIHAHGFPNLFVLGLAQAANLISNVPHNFVEAAGAITAIVKHSLAEGSEQVEVTADAEESWIEQLVTRSGGILGSPDCTPGYYNNEGRPMGRREQLNGSGYPQGPIAYFDYLESWRSSGEFEGLEFRSGVPQER